MPLLKGKKNIGKNIETEEAHGKPHDQAVAIALRTAGKAKGQDSVTLKSAKYGDLRVETEPSGRMIITNREGKELVSGSYPAVLAWLKQNGVSMNIAKDAVLPVAPAWDSLESDLDTANRGYTRSAEKEADALKAWSKNKSDQGLHTAYVNAAKERAVAWQKLDQAERRFNGRAKQRGKDSVEPISVEDVEGYTDGSGTFHPISGTKGYSRKKAGGVGHGPKRKKRLAKDEATLKYAAAPPKPRPLTSVTAPTQADVERIFGKKPTHADLGKVFGKAKDAELSTPEQHKLKVLRQLMKMPDAMIPIAGGGYNNRAEVEAALKKLLSKKNAKDAVEPVALDVEQKVVRAKTANQLASIKAVLAKTGAKLIKVEKIPAGGYEITYEESAERADDATNPNPHPYVMTSAAAPTKEDVERIYGKRPTPEQFKKTFGKDEAKPGKGWYIEFDRKQGSFIRLSSITDAAVDAAVKQAGLWKKGGSYPYFTIYKDGVEVEAGGGPNSGEMTDAAVKPVRVNPAPMAKTVPVSKAKHVKDSDAERLLAKGHEAASFADADAALRLYDEAIAAAKKEGNKAVLKEAQEGANGAIKHGGAVRKPSKARVKDAKDFKLGAPGNREEGANWYKTVPVKASGIIKSTGKSWSKSFKSREEMDKWLAANGGRVNHAETIKAKDAVGAGTRVRVTGVTKPGTHDATVLSYELGWCKVKFDDGMVREVSKSQCVSLGGAKDSLESEAAKSDKRDAKIIKEEAAGGQLTEEQIAQKHGFPLQFVKDVLAGKPLPTYKPGKDARAMDSAALIHAHRLEIAGDTHNALDLYNRAARELRRVGNTQLAARAQDGADACRRQLTGMADMIYSHPARGRSKAYDSEDAALRAALERTRAGEDVALVGSRVMPRSKAKDYATAGPEVPRFMESKSSQLAPGIQVYSVTGATGVVAQAAAGGHVLVDVDGGGGRERWEVARTFRYHDPIMGKDAVEPVAIGDGLHEDSVEELARRIKQKVKELKADGTVGMSARNLKQVINTRGLRFANAYAFETGFNEALKKADVGRFVTNDRAKDNEAQPTFKIGERVKIVGGNYEGSSGVVVGREGTYRVKVKLDGGGGTFAPFTDDLMKATDEHIGWKKLVGKLRRAGHSKESAEHIAGKINAEKYGHAKDARSHEEHIRELRAELRRAPGNTTAKNELKRLEAKDFVNGQDVTPDKLKPGMKIVAPNGSVQTVRSVDKNEYGNYTVSCDRGHYTFKPGQLVELYVGATDVAPIPVAAD